MNSLHIFYSSESFEKNAECISPNDDVVFMFYADVTSLINEKKFLENCKIYTLNDEDKLVKAICDYTLSEKNKLFYYS